MSAPRRAAHALVLVGAVLAGTRAGAQSVSRAEERRRVAQVVTLARTAADLCAHLETEESALRAMMSEAGVSDRDLVDPEGFGPANQLVARSFAGAVRQDPAAACGAVVTAFGFGRSPLLRRVGDLRP